MDPFERAATGVRSLLQQLPPGTHTGIAERSGSEVEQSDDYSIDWQIGASPVNPLACPVELVASRQPGTGCAWGFSFDRRGRIARHLGLRVGRRTSHIVAFGTEPIVLPPERVIAIVEAVVSGHAEMHYRSLARYLQKTAGVVLVAGAAQHFVGYGAPVGARRVFQYAPWSQAV